MFIIISTLAKHLLSLEENFLSYKINMANYKASAAVSYGRECKKDFICFINDFFNHVIRHIEKRGNFSTLWIPKFRGKAHPMKGRILRDAVLSLMVQKTNAISVIRLHISKYETAHTNLNASNKNIVSI